MNLKYLLRNGKNSNLGYYLRCYLRYATPKFISKWQLKRYLRQYEALSEQERAYVDSRVEYYCKLEPRSCSLPSSSERIGDNTLETHKKRMKNKRSRFSSTYLFDTQEHTRHFAGSLLWQYRFGDVITVPDVPAIVKSRPLSAHNDNSVVMKLDKNRHFVNIYDSTPFESKLNIGIFRGVVAEKSNRRRFLEQYFNHKMCDLGEVNHKSGVPEEWKKPLITLYDHLRYKFIFALEGNDVASNLKWVMSSNSVAVMPKPTCETWFMEGTLVGGEHYIEIAEDYSDLEQKLEYYIAHPEECKRISKNANRFVEQFLDDDREKLISVLVLKRYFEATSQL